MASGLLGSLNMTTSGSIASVYTVPAGISHAVVHINQGMNYNTSASIYINGVCIGVGTQATPFSTSVMLSPGDVVGVLTSSNPGAGQFAGITVTGYEVP